MSQDESEEPATIILSDLMNTKIHKLTEKSLYVVTQWHDYRKEHFYWIVGVFENVEHARKVMIDTCQTVHDNSRWMNSYPIFKEQDKATIMLNPDDGNDDGYEIELMIFQVEKVEPIQYAKANSTVHVLMNYYWSYHDPMNEENYVHARKVYFEKPNEYDEDEYPHEKYEEHNVIHKLELNKNYGGKDF